MHVSAVHDGAGHLGAHLPVVGSLSRPCLYAADLSGECESSAGVRVGGRNRRAVFVRTGAEAPVMMLIGAVLRGRCTPRRDEVMQQVLRRTLMVEPGTVRATVHDGGVTLTGRTAHDDDTATAARTPEPVALDPLRGWWTGRQPARPVRGSEADLPEHRNRSRSAALQ